MNEPRGLLRRYQSSVRILCVWTDTWNENNFFHKFFLLTFPEFLRPISVSFMRWKIDNLAIVPVNGQKSCSLESWKLLYLLCSIYLTVVARSINCFRIFCKLQSFTLMSSILLDFLILLLTINTRLPSRWAYPIVPPDQNLVHGYSYWTSNCKEVAEQSSGFRNGAMYVCEN